MATSVIADKCLVLAVVAARGPPGQHRTAAFWHWLEGLIGAGAW
jgi:hypothetical protein